MTPAATKHGKLVCPAYLDWLRTQPCHFGDDTCGPSRVHHYPPKGQGVLNDLSTIAVCDVEHRRCLGQVVIAFEPHMRLEPISEAFQHHAVLATFWRFWEEGPPEVKRKVFEAVEERDENHPWMSW